MDLRDSLIHQILIPPAIGVGNNEAALPLLDHAAPSISSLRWVLCGELAILLWTKDQNSSISSVESSRSRTNTSVSASACSAASTRASELWSRTLVAGDLLGRPKAAPAHHHQECSAYLFGRCAQPVDRGVVSLTEPGATASTVVTLTASQGAVSYHVRSRTIGIGTGRFGICGTHLEPLADLTCPHILQESLPENASKKFR